MNDEEITHSEGVGNTELAENASEHVPSLEWSIAGTLAWFNLRGRALGIADLQRLLLCRGASQADLVQTLAKMPHVQEQDGLYNLKGTDVTYPSAEAALYYRRKWRRAHSAVRLIRHLPYVRMVSVVNTVADKTAKPSSDVDLFIVIEHGRLYLTRTLITGVLQVFGLRRHGRKISDRMCLSWFASTAGMDIEPVTFAPYDLLLAYLFTEQVPLIDSGTTYERFMHQNRWIGRLVPDYEGRTFRARRPSVFSRVLEMFLNNGIGQGAEDRLMRWQRGRIVGKSPRTAATDSDTAASSEAVNDERADVRIIATNSMLKFHEKERRGVYRAQWETLMRQSGYDPQLVIT